MAIYYHGTSKKNKNEILKNGFKMIEEHAGHSLGNGIYFSNIKDDAMQYGDDLLTVKIDDKKINEFENVGKIQRYIYDKTKDISMKLLKECLISDGYIGIKQDEMIVIYDVNHIEIIS